MTTDEKARKFILIGRMLILAGILINGWTVSWFYRESPAYELIDLQFRYWSIAALFVVTGILLIRLKERAKLLLDIFMGVFFTALLVVAIEGVFFLLNESRSVDIWYEGGDFYAEDPLLGYKPAENLEIVSRMMREGEEVYSAWYTTSENGWRVTPFDETLPRDQFLLFFGDSITFGLGVDDDQTLPSWAAGLALDFEPYNFGFSGYGPEQMVALLENGVIEPIVEQETGIAIYTYIDEHIARAIGSVQVFNQWGRLMPYYYLDEDGALVRDGNFSTGRPFLSALYLLIGKSQVVHFLGLDFPAVRDRHVELVAGMIESSRDMLKDRYEDVAFYVLFYPGYSETAPDLIPYLETAGINYLDYGDLLHLEQPGMWIEYDGHPTGEAYEIVAEKLVDDLGIRTDQ